MSKTLDSLLFAQGGKCFFCRSTLLKEDASIEHLLAKSNGGTNVRDNLVACCRTLNDLFADISVKEKLQIVLNQAGTFSCPPKVADRPGHYFTRVVNWDSGEDFTDYIVANLLKRGAAKPATLLTLTNTIKAILPSHFTESIVHSQIQRLIKNHKIAINNGRVVYLI
jgi:hypothetical protein